MTNLYTLKNVNFNYDAHFSLVDVCAEIKKANITAIVGPNGSGKTSLLNILSFMIHPHSGSLHYDGEPLSANNIATFKRTVGYIQQNPYLLLGTAFKNIELGLKLRHIDKATRIKKVFDVMQLLGIAALSNRDARTLSGGEAQKVAIGQVLVLAPEVLILDEPFTHLDKKSIYELEQLILKLKDDFGKTIVFTTHNQYQAQHLADAVFSAIKGNIFTSQAINLFSGDLDFEKHSFNTGKQLIILPEGVSHAENIAIDSKQIVLSNHKLDSSMQNSFRGKITGLVEEIEQVKISVEAGETFQTIVTHKAFAKLGLSIGADVWISFKSSSIRIF